MKLYTYFAVFCFFLGMYVTKGNSVADEKVAEHDIEEVGHVMDDLDVKYAAGGKDPASEAKLDALDASLTTAEKKKKMSACFTLTPKFMHQKPIREALEHMKPKMAKAKGYREDDVNRLIFFGFLTTCYHQMTQSFLRDFKPDQSEISKEAIVFFKRRPETPLQLSKNQIRIMEKLAAEDFVPPPDAVPENKSKDQGLIKGVNVSRRFRFIYLIIAFAIIAVIFYVAVLYLSPSGKPRGKTKKKKGT